MSQSHTAREAFDVAIVGAGAAGCLFAARFARAGRSVIVLEAGPAWRLDMLTSSQIRARRLKWGGAAVELDGAHRFGHNFSTGWGLGGAALHHYAGWPRLHPEDFRTRTLYGRALDWPIDYEVLRPHYDRIQAEVGIAGDAEREIWRPPGEPYPMPPLPVFRQGHVISKGFERLGFNVSPAPLAIASVRYQERPPCVHDGWCDAGCPTGALANPLVTHHPQAVAAGARFVTGATAQRVRVDRRGRGSGIDYTLADGTRQTVRASLVVLAAAAVQNVRLLLGSPSEQHPEGLANSSGLVGRPFRCHTVANVYGVFEEPLDNHLGVTAGSLMCQDGYRKDGRKGSFGSYQWGIAPALKPNDLLGIANTRPELYGARLQRFLETDAPRIGTISAVCEALTDADNRIELAPSTDRAGEAVPRIVNDLSGNPLALWRHALGEGVRVLEAAGAREVWTGVMPTTHAAGGTIMGTDPARSVTDSYGRTHDVQNLLIAGASLFPTLGGGSPTFTLYALADRAAMHVLDHWSDYAA